MNLRVIQKAIFRRARKVNVRASDFLRKYDRFVNALVATQRGKFEDNFIDYAEGYVQGIFKQKAMLSDLTDASRFRQINVIGDRLIAHMRQLQGKGFSEKEIVTQSRTRLLFIKLFSAVRDVIYDIFRSIKDMFPGIGFDENTRRFKGIAITFFMRGKADAITEEEEAMAVGNVEIKQELRRKKNEDRVEQVASDDGLVVERSRMFGKVVFVGMTPEDQEQMENSTKRLRESNSDYKDRRKEIRSEIDSLQGKSRRSDDPDVKRSLENEVFDKKGEVRGKHVGNWEGEDGTTGQWEAVRESASTKMIQSHVITADEVKGLWSFKGLDNDLVKVVIAKDGKVSSRQKGDKVSGRIYDAGGSINGWIRIYRPDKYKVELSVGNEVGGLDDSIKQTQEMINEIRDQFDRYVYDPNDDEMEPQPISNWVKGRKKSIGEQGSSNVLDIADYLKQHEESKAPDEVLNMVLDGGAKVKWRGLTDSKVSEAMAVTKMYPTVEIGDVEYIADGELKGYPLALVVNSAGRMLKGSAFALTEEDGRMSPIEIPRNDGQMEYCVNEEPYLTVNDNDQLMMVIPTEGKGTSGVKHPTNKAVESLANVSSTIKRDNTMLPKHSHIVAYTVGEADVDDLRSMLGGMTMSQEAKQKMEKFYDERSRVYDLDKEYEDFTVDDVPGLKKEIDGKPLELKSFQKKAISHIASKGNGNVSLDTGLGKGICMISSLLKWIDDGTLDKRNGKALFVTPASLRGNIPTEVKKFCENPEEVLEKIEVVSYDGFLNMEHSEIEEYGAVFFDEAQAMKNAMGNSPSKRAEHALKLNHPHKVLATASPLEKSPEDLYSLYMIANNEYNADPEDVKEKRDAFLKDNCVMSGNRAVAVKNNPQAIQRMQSWVKTHFLYVDKEQVRDEIGLKGATPPEQQTVQVTMNEEQASAYEDIASDIMSTLETMKRRYQDREQVGAGDIESELKRQGVMSEIIELREISNDTTIYLRKKRMRELALNLYGKDPRKRNADNRLTKEEREVVQSMAERDVPEQPNSKLDRTNQVVSNSVSRGKKTACWTDQPSFAQKAGMEIAKAHPGKHVAVCLSGMIYIISSSGNIEVNGTSDGDNCYPVEIRGKKPCTVKATFKKGTYLYPDGTEVPADQWQKFIMDYVLSADPNMIAVVLTSSYSTGHNLQWISSVVHLDRDNWNNETMKQRTARCYRQGQPEDVDIEILDSIVPDGSETISINEVQRWMQEMEEGLFDEIVRKSMTTSLTDLSVQFSEAQKAVLEAGEPLTKEQLMAMISPNDDTQSKVNGVSK